MEANEVSRTWRRLILPFVLGVVLLIVAVLCHRLGSKRPGPQTFWFFAGVLGGVFTMGAGLKLVKFRKYLSSTGPDRNQG